MNSTTTIIYRKLPDTRSFEMIEAAFPVSFPNYADYPDDIIGL